MATTRKAPWEEDEEAVVPQPGGFYDQLGVEPVGSVARPTTTGKARVTANATANAQGAAAPTNTLDYSTLTGGPPQPQQRNTAPPLTEMTSQGAGGQQLGPADAGFWVTLPSGQQVPYNHPLAAPGGAAPGGTPGGGTPSPRPSWMTSATYTPEAIGTDDIPSANWRELLAAMGPDYVPTTVSGGNTQARDVEAEDFDPYNFAGWGSLPGYGAGPLEGQTDDLIARIIANPESLDARTVARMKAASREEQSEFGRMEQEELTGLGYDKGIEDSNFLASERLQSRRNRDAAITGSNRGIEIDAAKTNAGDRRAAATLASAYVDSKARQKLAERAQVFGEQAEGERNKQATAASKQARAEYLTGVKGDNANRQLEAAKVRMQADVANNANLFEAAKLRQDKVLGSVDADIKRVAATTDRYALREQVKQAATELGISQDKLLADWLKAQADDLTQRYGIDVAKEVDLRKLDQAGSEFKEDMAFRIMALEQEMRFKYAQLDESGRQFDYGYGLDAAALQQNADQFGVNSYFRSQGL